MTINRPMNSGSTLIPILREGIEIIKVIAFKDLRDHLRASRCGWDHDFATKVTAAVVNSLFGVETQEPIFADFVTTHRQTIEEVQSRVGVELSGLRIPLTDALRTMVLCDHQEGGRDTSALLERARDCGVLLIDRDLPLPNHFIDLVRRLGTAKGVLQSVAQG